MKKKLAMVAFTIVCTIAITISIASFTLGMDDSGAQAAHWVIFMMHI